VGDPLVDADEFGRWRAEADAALRSARLQSEAGPHNWACFAAEQATKLAVKGHLHGLGRGPWGHDLVRLGELLADVGEVPGAVEDALRRLSRHYIPARYPDAHPSGPPGIHYGPADSAQAVADAEGVLAHVDGLWEAVSR